MSADKTFAATNLLAAMLAGASQAHESIGMDDLVTDGDTGLSATLVTPSGDRYRVSVVWLKDESP